MITFSTDPKRAEHEMHAVIFYLVTFGYIDGDFDDKERGFVKETIRRLIDHRARQAMPDAPEKVRNEVVAKFTAHFHEVFDGIDHSVKEHFTESVSENEDPKAFVHSKLKVRCFEIFQSFDRNGQHQLMELIDSLLLADGVAHPAELQFRSELAQQLEADIDIDLVPAEMGEIARVRVSSLSIVLTAAPSCFRRLLTTSACFWNSVRTAPRIFHTSLDRFSIARERKPI